MDSRLGVELDSDVNALYVRVTNAAVSESIEIAANVVVDVDEHGSTVGFEFIDADAFLPFLREHGGTLPSTARWTDRQGVAD